jgi:putative transposase
MIEFKGSHFERDVILWAVRWYVAYPVSYRQLEEMMEEHGVEVDHATLNRWVLKFVSLLDQEFRARKTPVGSSWRMDETYVKVKGAWKYLYRAVDKAGATIDFLLTAKRDRKAALRFLRKAIKWNGTPAKITIDKSGANMAAIESHNAGHEAGIEIRQVKYLNNIVEQDHRAIKRLVRPMLGFKSFRSAAVTLAGIELMHMRDRPEPGGGQEQNRHLALRRGCSRWPPQPDGSGSDVLFAPRFWTVSAPELEQDGARYSNPSRNRLIISSNSVNTVSLVDPWALASSISAVTAAANSSGATSCKSVFIINEIPSRW